MKKVKDTLKNDKQLLLVAHDIKLAKILAGNNKKLRDRTIKRLGKWLSDRTKAAPVPEDVFMRIWKGLFYSMWMSDKPLVQEECAEKIAQLVHFDDIKTTILFFKCFLQIMVNEWFGIDFHRLDKFLMLVRRVLRQTLEALRKECWDEVHIKRFNEALNQTVFKEENVSALGLAMHIDEIFLEEVAKVSNGRLSEYAVLCLLQPFMQQLARYKDVKQINHVNIHLFRYLMEQSDLGLEYKVKFDAWKKQGFPGGSIDAMERVTLDDEDDEVEAPPEDDPPSDDEATDAPKDPRAGKVHVELPQLQFDAKEVAEALQKIRFKPYTSPAARKIMDKMVSQFREMANGSYPIGLKKVATVNDDGYSTKIKSSLKRLQNFEQSLETDTKKAKTRKERNRQIKQIALMELEKYATEHDKEPEENDEETEDSDQTNNDDDLEAFIAKSEAGLFENNTESSPINKDSSKKKKRKRSTTKTDDTVENETQKVKKPKKVTNEVNGSSPVVKKRNKFIRNSGTWLVDEIVSSGASPSSKNDWNQPLQDGETEIFVVSNKTKNKLKQMAQKQSVPVPEFINNFSNKFLNGGESSPKKNIVKNPFSECTPTKRIKFALNLNKSQDFHEHQEQITNSPGIPYDASRRPSKPLLKPSPTISPINPFYRRKVRL